MQAKIFFRYSVIYLETLLEMPCCFHRCLLKIAVTKIFCIMESSCSNWERTQSALPNSCCCAVEKTGLQSLPCPWICCNCRGDEIQDLWKNHCPLSLTCLNVPCPKKSYRILAFVLFLSFYVQGKMFYLSFLLGRGDERSRPLSLKHPILFSLLFIWPGTLLH